MLQGKAISSLDELEQIRETTWLYSPTTQIWKRWANRKTTLENGIYVCNAPLSITSMCRLRKCYHLCVVCVWIGDSECVGWRVHVFDEWKLQKLMSKLRENNSTIFVLFCLSCNWHFNHSQSLESLWTVEFNEMKTKRSTSP